MYGIKSAWVLSDKISQNLYKPKKRSFFDIIIFACFFVFYVGGLNIATNYITDIKLLLMCWLVGAFFTPLLCITIYRINNSDNPKIMEIAKETVFNRKTCSKVLRASPIIFIATAIFYFSFWYIARAVISHKNDLLVWMPYILCSILFIAGVFYSGIWFYGAYIEEGVKPIRAFVKSIVFFLKNLLVFFFVWLRSSKPLLVFLIIFGCVALMINYSSEESVNGSVFLTAFASNFVLAKIILVIDLLVLYFQLYIWVLFFFRSYSKDIMSFCDPEVFKN